MLGSSIYDLTDRTSFKEEGSKPFLHPNPESPPPYNPPASLSLSLVFPFGAWGGGNGVVYGKKKGESDLGV